MKGAVRTHVAQQMKEFRAYCKTYWGLLSSDGNDYGLSIGLKENERFYECLMTMKYRTPDLSFTATWNLYSATVRFWLRQDACREYDQQYQDMLEYYRRKK